MPRLTIDTDDLVRLFEAQQIIGARSNRVLTTYGDRLGRITIGHVSFWSRKKLTEYRDNRPPILTAAEVGRILGVSATTVRGNLERLLQPATVVWGEYPRMRSYDMARVLRLKELRDQNPNANYSDPVYRELLAPVAKSQGAAPTVVGKLAGDRPRQVCKPKGRNHSRIGEAVERIKTDAVNHIDHKGRR